MSTSTERQLVPIRIENPGEILMTGLSGEFNSPKGIPELWQEFVPYLGKIPSQVGSIAYGIIINPDPISEKFDYMAAVRVNSFADVPT
jgi:AraC family transcriptional regulator